MNELRERLRVFLRRVLLNKPPYDYELIAAEQAEAMKQAFLKGAEEQRKAGIYVIGREKSCCKTEEETDENNH